MSAYFLSVGSILAQVEAAVQPKALFDAARAARIGLADEENQ